VEARETPGPQLETPAMALLQTENHAYLCPLQELGKRQSTEQQSCA
jgi:hypothetical protein